VGEWSWGAFLVGALVGLGVMWVGAVVALRTPPEEERW